MGLGVCNIILVNLQIVQSIVSLGNATTATVLEENPTEGKRPMVGH